MTAQTAAGRAFIDKAVGCPPDFVRGLVSNVAAIEAEAAASAIGTIADRIEAGSLDATFEPIVERGLAEARTAALDEAIAAVEALRGYRDPRYSMQFESPGLVHRSVVLEALRGLR